MTTYDQLESAVDHFITHYRDDLIIHDRDWIADNPGIPFIHATRDTGTHLIPMHPATSDAFPPADATVPLGFSHGTRYDVLNYFAGMLDYATKPIDAPTRLFHHWTGSRLVKITADRAREIFAHYDRTTRAKFESPRLHRATA